MEPSGDAEEREAKEQLATVDGGRDERHVSTGNRWRDIHKREEWRDLRTYIPPPPLHGVKGLLDELTMVRGKLGLCCSQTMLLLVHAQSPLTRTSYFTIRETGRFNNLLVAIAINTTRLAAA